MIEVIRPGPLLTVQDLGRTGYQRLGIPVSGAMDPVSLRIGNLLASNPQGAAGLEAALSGTEFKAYENLLAAVTGGAAEIELDGVRLPSFRSFVWERGAVLKLRGRPAGAWTYLAVAGGIDVPEVLGSRSTCLVAGFGGFRGRALRAGDLVPVGRAKAGGRFRQAGRRLNPELFMWPGRQKRLRVIMGPHVDRFDGEGIRAFLSEAYEVTPQSGRMGARLRGAAVKHLSVRELLSCAATFGTVQVPADGQPVLLLADRQTTGGYPQIATVISADLPLAAQLLPGDRVAFERVKPDEARRILAERERLLRLLAFACRF